MATHKASASKSSQAVERQLERYRSMRDFHKTAEPRGGSDESAKPAKANPALPFVIQKHAATRLHYDFRLGWRGVLKSWAVTKGPSFYPGDKRLAVQVEDHPIEYGGFEGTIPKGQYGGGTVMVWDFGDWVPDGDVDEGLQRGNLKFELRGKKLKGKWALVRMHGRAEREDKPNWLLIKEKDEYARAEGAPAITDQAAESAITHRDLEQIAASEDHVWDSSVSRSNSGGSSTKPENAGAKSKASTKNAHPASAASGALLNSAPREKAPAFIAPQLAQTAAKAPNGDEWIHELKLDGYRIQIHIDGNVRRKGSAAKVRLLTRNGLDWTLRMPDIAKAAATMDVESAVLDGEVVALDDSGTSSFADLQAAFQDGKQAFLIFYAFDLLHLNGRNVRSLPLAQRKALLADAMPAAAEDFPLRISEHLHARGEDVFAKACSLGAEGIVSKLAESKYASGRGNSWLKVKCIQEQEFVIVGFTYPSKGGHGIGALLLGYYEDGKLRYAGRSGTGFTQATQRTLRTKLDGLAEATTKVADVPASARRGVTWVRPELVAQIAFATWTRDKMVRQAAFKGLREDKSAKEVVREAAESPNKQARATAIKKHATVRIASQTSAPRLRDGSKDGLNDGSKGGKGMTTLAITHPEKILDVESGLTKQALAEYYMAVAERMLPHIEDRPLSVVRCPEGSGKPCFYQKHVGMGLGKGVKSVSVPNRRTGKMEEFLTVDSSEGLVGLAQMGVLEIHPWGSKNESLEKADRIIFDLDPDAAIRWEQLATCAKELRARLKKLGLESFLKSTGGKGLHIVVPIAPEYEWPRVKQFAHDIVLEIEREDPKLFITKMTKAARTNRIYLDYLRNDRESTAVAPWSPRARTGIPVAMPLGWKELDAEAPPKFHVADFEQWRADRLRRDPWKAMVGMKQPLPDSSRG